MCSRAAHFESYQKNRVFVRRILKILNKITPPCGAFGKFCELTAPAAYWAAWADALPAVRGRRHRGAENYVVMLEANAEDATHCFAEAARARRSLQDEGWSECPTGALYLKELALPHQPRTARGIGHMVGRTTQRIHTEHYRDRVLCLLFFFGTFFRLQYPCGSLCTAPQLQPTRMGRRLLAGVACQRASARSSCRAGSGPPALHSPPGGNSSRDAAKARCAATALHLTTHAALAAARREVGTSAARARASKRMKVAASGAHQPPTSSPNTTRRQRRARSSSG